MKIKDKCLALKLLKGRLDGTDTISINDIVRKTGYSKRQLIRWSHELKEKDIEELLSHGNKGRKPINAVPDTEINYIINFKAQYPNITIAQFLDIYHEDVIFNKSMQDDVYRYHLKERSYSFIRSLFIKYDWSSPVKRRKRKEKGREHLLREPSPRRGMLIQIDGTPFDWFSDRRMYTLHLLVDDATSEIIAGWFMRHECQLGYSHCIRIMIEKYGIPIALYSDKHSIFRNNQKEEDSTQFAMIIEDLGIEMIYANSSEAKGRIERANGTIQRRLPNDIKRFDIKDYDELNTWFNSFYKDYLNTKFAFIAKDPNSEFVMVDETFDSTKYFCLRYERTMNRDMFKINNFYYAIFDDNGELIRIRDKTKILVCIDVFTKTVYIYRYGKKYMCYVVAEVRKERMVSNQKELIDELEDIAKRRNE